MALDGIAAKGQQTAAIRRVAGQLDVRLDALRRRSTWPRSTPTPRSARAEEKCSRVPAAGCPRRIRRPDLLSTRPPGASLPSTAAPIFSHCTTALAYSRVARRAAGLRRPPLGPEGEDVIDSERPARAATAACGRLDEVPVERGDDFEISGTNCVRVGEPDPARLRDARQEYR